MTDAIWGALFGVVGAIATAAFGYWAAIRTQKEATRIANEQADRSEARLLREQRRAALRDLMVDAMSAYVQILRKIDIVAGDFVLAKEPDGTAFDPAARCYVHALVSTPSLRVSARVFANACADAEEAVIHGRSGKIDKKSVTKAVKFAFSQLEAEAQLYADELMRS